MTTPQIRIVRFNRSAAALFVSLGTAVLVSACENMADDSEATKSAVFIGPTGHALDYIVCATEGGTCRDAGLMYVAYGAHGRFLFRKSDLVGNTPCTNAFFGGDPAVGFTKTCYLSNYAYTGLSENQLGGTQDSLPRNIAYGANGVFNFATLTGAYTCNSATFGDPIVGVTKACYYAAVNMTFGDFEGGTLTGLVNTPVAYGANGKHVFMVASGSIGCSNAAFGSDPAVGVGKLCYKLPMPFITDEYSPFNAGSSSRLFRYGSGLNGNFLSKVLSGTVSCSNTTFTGDPDPGPLKHCYGP